MYNKYYLKPAIKSYIEYILRIYCKRQKELAQYRTDMMPSYTVKLDGAGSMGGKLADITADTAVRLVTDTYILRAELNCRAVKLALHGIDDTDATLIKLVYFDETHKPDGAANEANISVSQAYERIKKILYRIAVELGEVNI